MLAEHLGISRDTLKKWEQHFVDHGTISLLPELSYVAVDPRLEKLTVLIKSCRPRYLKTFLRMRNRPKLYFF